MILVDANLLVYARISTLPQHGAARQWLDARLSDHPRVGLPWTSLLGFLRIVTSPRLPISPLWPSSMDWRCARPMEILAAFPN